MANINFGVNILPKANNTYSLGNSDYKWNIYANTINGVSPENLGLPAVTSSDNDKILKVANGAWSIATAEYLTSHQDISGKANSADLATVATTGDYDDLINKPTIPTIPTNISTFTNDAGYLTSHQDISGKANSADLATVATTGSYTDLINKPTIPDISLFAPKANPEFTGSISLERKANTTIGNKSVAIGYNTTASGQYSIALGNATVADGRASFVGGTSSFSPYNNSIVYGENLVGRCRAAFGKYNAYVGYDLPNWESNHQYQLNDSIQYNGVVYICKTAHTSSTTYNNEYWMTNSTSTDLSPIFQIGNGSSTTRKNLLTITDDKMYFSGDIYTNCEPTTYNESNIGGYKLATESYVTTAIANAQLSGGGNSSLATVATTGDYTDLINKPTIPDVSGFYTKPSGGIPAADLAETYLTSHQDISGKANSADLATVATTGDYADLINKPIIPTIPTNISTFTNDAGYLTSHQDISGKANSADLATVATSGSYNDLINTPTIPTIPTNVSSFTNDAGYLTSHQDISGKANSADLATVATSGDYGDLLNKPDLSVYLTSVPTMTGATSSAAGTAGLIPAPASADREKFFRGDGTWQDGGKPMVILSYGNSTWNDFITAYNNNVIVYCRASSNSNPASGSQTRMAFMAYVNDATNPANVEFQYYRSMSTHSATAMGDEVYVYKLTNASGGTWSVTTRKASIKEIAVASGSKLGVSWSSDKVTLSNTMTADDMPMSSSDATTAKAAIDTLNNQIAPKRLTTVSFGSLVPEGTSFAANESYQIGKIVVLNFKINLGDSWDAQSKNIITGLPIPKNDSGITSNAFIVFLNLKSYDTNKGTAIGINSSGQLQGTGAFSVPLSGTFAINGVYVAQ